MVDAVRLQLWYDSSLSTGSVDALDSDEGLAGLLSDKPVLFFDRSARRGIAVEPAEDFTWNSAIGALGSIFVDHIKEDESFARCGLSCHSRLRSVAYWWRTPAETRKSPARVSPAFISSLVVAAGIPNGSVYRPPDVDINPLAEDSMAFKPNYRRDRLERDRAARARMDEKQKKKEERAAKRKAERVASEAHGEDEQG